VAPYVTLFAVGHSVTLLYGVLSGTNANAHIVDAIIGGSVVYKGFDNMGVAKGDRVAVTGEADVGRHHGHPCPPRTPGCEGEARPQVLRSPLSWLTITAVCIRDRARVGADER